MTFVQCNCITPLRLVATLLHCCYSQTFGENSSCKSAKILAKFSAVYCIKLSPLCLATPNK